MKQTEYVISIRARITVSFNGKAFCCSTLLFSEVNSRSTVLYSLPKSVVDTSTVNAFKARLGSLTAGCTKQLNMILQPT